LFVLNTECPTRCRARHLFNNFTTNDNIATKFVADLPHCVRNVKEKNVLLFKFRCNIFFGVGIIKEMPGSVAVGTPCMTVFRLCLVPFKQMFIINCGSQMKSHKTFCGKKTQGFLMLKQVVCVLTTVL
jgi:hypothetical protein